MKPPLLLLICVLATNHSTHAFLPNRRIAPVTNSDVLVAFSTKELVSTESSQGINQETETFQNNGVFSFMQSYLSLGGIKEGKAITWGIIAADVDESAKSSAEDRVALREEAAANMHNIGMAERERRDLIGTVFGGVTLMYAIWSALLVDGGDLMGHFTRFMIMFPLALSLGLKDSAKAGL